MKSTSPSSILLIPLLLIALAQPALAVRFQTNLDPEFDKALNAMWQRFGVCEDGAVQRFGNEPAYFEWMGLKVMWADDEAYRNEFVAKVRDFPISENGYVWSWGDQHLWPTGDGSPHQENNAKYILGVYRIVSWLNSRDFLNARDATTTPNRADPAHRDVSQGMTVMEKARAAMRYQLEALHGEDSLLVMDNGLNTGKVDGHPTNYWDNFPFGFRDAYTNIYFHASLGAMAGLETIAGATEQAEYYRALAEECRDRYDRTFWQQFRGRYIGCIGEDGIVRDYGFTFLNLEALVYGLGDAEKARSIFSWLDGTRIIESDTSQGEDIYAFRIAPRSITRAVESNGPPFWWFDLNGQIRPDTNATFGEHLENGGIIFYTSYYDIMARARYLGATAAFERFQVIVDEFKKDGLLRDPVNNAGAPWQMGVIGEFPESGLVPAAFLYAFLGIDADPEALILKPNLPASITRASVDRLWYAGQELKITVTDDRQIDIEILFGHRKPFQVRFENLVPEATYSATARRLDSGTAETLLPLWSDETGKGAMTIEQPDGVVISIRRAG